MRRREQGPGGIGGWLLIFLLSVGIGTPLSGVFRIIGFARAHPFLPQVLGARWWPLFQAEQWGVVALYALTGWYVVWRMVLVRRWSSVRFAIAALWTLPLLRVTVESGFTAVEFGASWPNTLLNRASLLLGTAVSTLSWTAYLLRSRRVHATYPRPGAVPHLVDIFT